MSEVKGVKCETCGTFASLENYDSMFAWMDHAPISWLKLESPRRHSTSHDFCSRECLIAWLTKNAPEPQTTPKKWYLKWFGKRQCA